jgi:hypothetical protein
MNQLDVRSAMHAGDGETGLIGQVEQTVACCFDAVGFSILPQGGSLVTVGLQLDFGTLPAFNLQVAVDRIDEHYGLSAGY